MLQLQRILLKQLVEYLGEQELSCVVVSSRWTFCELPCVSLTRRE